MNIQFNCICGQHFQDTPSSTPLYCPNCQLSFISPPSSFSTFACICSNCRVLNPYSIHWDQKIRCSGCQKKFVTPSSEELWIEWQKGEKKRLEQLYRQHKQEQAQQLQNIQKESLEKEETLKNECFQLTEERNHYHQQWQFSFDEKTAIEGSLFEAQQYIQTQQEALAETQHQLKSIQEELLQNQNSAENTLNETKKAWKATQKDLEKIEKLLIESTNQHGHTSEALRLTEERVQSFTQQIQELQERNQAQEQQLNQLTQQLQKQFQQIEEKDQELLALQKKTEFLQQEKFRIEALLSLEKETSATEVKRQEELLKHLQLTQQEKQQEKQQLEQKIQQLEQDLETQQMAFQQKQNLWESQKSNFQQEQETQKKYIQLLQKEKEEFAYTHQNNQSKLESFRQEVNTFLQQLEDFFYQRFQWLQPRWARLAPEKVCSQHDQLAGKKASTFVFERCTQGEQLLLLETLTHLKTALASEIKFQYERAIQIKSKQIQDLQQKIPFVQKKLNRLTAFQKEFISTLNTTTNDTLQLLSHESQTFFQALRPPIHEVPCSKWIQTTNKHFQHFCHHAVQIHQDILQEIISTQFKVLYLQIPWSQAITFSYPATSFNPRVFQAPMFGKEVIELPKQLGNFFPIFFLSYWPRPQLALSLYQDLILEEAQDLLSFIFQAQLKLTQEAVCQFQTQQLLLIQQEYDAQIEKQKRFLIQLHAEKETLEFQKARLNQRLQDLEQIQNGILLLLQDLENPFPSEKKQTFELFYLKLKSIVTSQQDLGAPLNKPRED